MNLAVQVERSGKALGSDALEAELAVRHANGRDGKAPWGSDEEGCHDAGHAGHACGNGELNGV